MKAYLSYQFGDDVSGITNLLRDKNIDVFDSLTDMVIENSLNDAIRKSIFDADFAILVYTKPNTNLSFEAGIALGLNKPLFVILAPSIETQDYFLECTYVHTLPGETDKILFSLDLFLKNLKPRTFERSNKTVFYGGGDPAPSDYFYNKFTQSKEKAHNKYEDLFKEIFNLYHLSFVDQFSMKGPWRPDFSIWSDKLASVMTNPILIEIKIRLDHLSVEKLQEGISDMLAKRPSCSFLVFYDELTGISKKELPNNPKCFYIHIADLMDNLRMMGFDEAIKKIRNQIVHNIY